MSPGKGLTAENAEGAEKDIGRMSEKGRRFFEQTIPAMLASREISFRPLDTEEVDDVLDDFMALIRDEMPLDRVHKDVARRPDKITGRYFRNPKACDQQQSLDASATYRVVYLVGHANLGYEIQGARALGDLWHFDEAMFVRTLPAGDSYFVGHHGEAWRIDE